MEILLEGKASTYEETMLFHKVSAPKLGEIRVFCVVHRAGIFNIHNRMGCTLLCKLSMAFLSFRLAHLFINL